VASASITVRKPREASAATWFRVWRRRSWRRRRTEGNPVQPRSRGPAPEAQVKLGEDVTHRGSLKVVMSDNVTVTVSTNGFTVSVTPTLDFYTDADGHVHVVVGSVQPNGTWEIVSDITIPFL
jgi:hypothetical protein